ncbi:hypothetical protein [Ammoniphilus sp. 3BR4]|uniref:hypothetical protein n=1 Tax=Ammoniphilus sp. 3BR4 TaxID=3158265 RepID=UPI0034657D77
MDHYFVYRLRKKLDRIVRHPEFRKLKESAGKTLGHAYIPVPLTAKMIQAALVQAQIENVQKLKVTIHNSLLYIQGEARKWMIKIPFSLVLQPAKVHGRTVAFLIQEMTPILNETVNQQIFNRPPYLHYQDRHIYLDLNQLDLIRSIKRGSIKQMEIKEDLLWLKIGM